MVSALPNLSALAAAATEGPWATGHGGFGVGDVHSEPDAMLVAKAWPGVGVLESDNAALIAAAPDMAALLIECAEALVLFASTSCVHESGPTVSGRHPRDASECRYCIARAALARLADFDGSIG